MVDAKTRIENLDELPRFSYPVEGSVVGVITSDEAFDEFAAKVRADIEGVLAEYEIDDAATLQGYYGVLARLDLMDGDYEAALARTEQIRELETKEAGKLMTGLFAKAWVAARDEVGSRRRFRGLRRRLRRPSRRAGLGAALGCRSGRDQGSQGPRRDLLRELRDRCRQEPGRSGGDGQR